MKLVFKGRLLTTSNSEVNLYPEWWVLSQPFTHEVSFDGEIHSQNQSGFLCSLSALGVLISWREE